MGDENAARRDLVAPDNGARQWREERTARCNRHRRPGAF